MIIDYCTTKSNNTIQDILTSLRLFSTGLHQDSATANRCVTLGSGYHQ